MAESASGGKSDFVHLHVHSQYSFLDGAIRLKDLVKRAVAHGSKAVALTDHGNMFGAITFYKSCKEAGLKPILGCEVNVAPGAQSRARADATTGAGHHLVLLARTDEGYRNLIHLVSMGWVDGKSTEGTPRIDLDLLAQKSKGLTALTGCMGGAIAQAILEQGADEGLRVAGKLKEIFEPGELFVELQNHGFPEQPALNGILRDLAKRLELPRVATNDVHYPSQDDADAHLVLSCIGSGQSLETAKAHHHGSKEIYLKSASEMALAFSDDPESLRNTLAVAERIELKLKLGVPMLPDFKVPEGTSLDEYFRHVSREGLERRFTELSRIGKNVDRDAYRKRLEIELDVICGMKFPGYFLIVWDFIRYAKENGIPVGPGRGSGAGSIVAYSLRITDLDPIPYNLLFERFLNPERVSMPDFDVDFCMDKRQRVIEYVAEKYGTTSVGQIATFAELKAKSVLKDVGRTMGVSPAETQRLANLIPMKGPGQTYTIPESLEREPKLKALVDTDPRVAALVVQATKLEGLTRQAGMHAAGVVISEGPLWDHVPVFTGAGGELVTQYYKDDVELAGLVKFDFLGLKTLTVLDIAVRLVNARPEVSASGAPFVLEAIPLDDEATFKLLQSGETKGVFQLESSGMQGLFKDLKPTSFEDVVAAVALYRPGPLGSGMVKDFVDCKNGRKEITSLHPLVDDTVAPTYGVIVYQEQVMQIAQKLAGYSLGGADLLRRAMGKKKPEEMAKQKSVFVEGAIKNNVAEADATRIFELLEYFAGYGFNKSHSAAYGLITYQTAYLKAHYPVEFMCASMSADKEKIDKVVRLVAEGRSMGISILPPDINESGIDFSVVYDGSKKIHEKPKKRGERRIEDPLEPKIRFGLGAVRGVGEAAIEAVLEARNDGAFKDLFDFASRVDAKRINKSVLESLVCSGAFDSGLKEQHVHRAGAHASIERAMERSKAASKDRSAGQSSLFGLFAAATAVSTSATASAQTGVGSSGDRYADVEPWDSRELLSHEKKALGFYLSAHPLDRYGPLPVQSTESLAGKEERTKVKLAGMVEGFRERVMKTGASAGQKMAFFELEDKHGRVEVKVRPQQLEACAAVLASGEPVMIKGIIGYDRRQSDDAGEDDAVEPTPQVVLDDALLLSSAIAQETRAVTLRLTSDRARKETLVRLAELLRTCRGGCPVAMLIAIEDGSEVLLDLGLEFRVQANEALLAGVERLVGDGAIELRGTA
ncbi:MAG: DNA polymerase III subunit alpha [Polyangiales bacterium]